jgi:hypothetical protein
MSADNGIYILCSQCEQGNEYRVAHCLAIDNIYYDPDCDGFNSKVLVEYFKECNVFTDETMAMDFALKLYQEVGFTEYGIVHINLPRNFKYYLEKA